MIIVNPIAALLYFVCLGIDVVMFFLMIRLLLTWRRIRWLEKFDKAGELLVDGVTSRTDKFWRLRLNRKLSAKGTALVALLFLTVIKTVVVIFSQCLFNI